MAPTANSLRRALKRTRNGATPDNAEAAVLLQARNENPADLATSTARPPDADLEAADRPSVITYSTAPVTGDGGGDNRTNADCSSTRDTSGSVADQHAASIPSDAGVISPW
ncbi:hypothetical protein GCM10010246_13610 [Streptomyces cuspidosporus]|uniref:Uncharacterized protein n=1 Tax=Streptomyces cuspidosporus TaxID=66882 RepID=A0ABN3FJV2_9ACTN